MKVAEDLSYVVLLRKKFSYLESIPGVLLPHPSSSAFPASAAPEIWAAPPPPPMDQFYDAHLNQQVRILPSMSSLEALLSKLPSVSPGPSGPASPSCYEMPELAAPGVAVPGLMMGMERVVVAKEEEIEEEEDEEEVYGHERSTELRGESSGSMHYYVNVGNSRPGESGF